MIKNIDMQILRRPPQYAVLAGLIFLAIPIFLLNIWVVQKGAIVKTLRSPDNIWWLATFGAWVFATYYWLMRVRWSGLGSFLALAVVMLMGNVYFLVAAKNYALAFYSLFVLILSAIYAAHVYRHLREPYYDSGQRWFEGQPRFLPRLQAAIKNGDQTIPARVSRLGAEGCYAFSESIEENLAQIEAVQLKLGELELNCAVELVSQTKDGAGRGLRFIRDSADQDKDIRDFIDRVRSAGYVS